ncbi:hypothetical protein PYH37_003816 [Sinorhizobium numidicum]|uniref:Uncharacterized protein n=1 Tax=Sinorhizobium numidicum TaxID=680248 RepID=A0ABY8CUF5_9HYPH|nr:hypothetical protein [Sinorhizobium numidicum]WEX78879.1 hypothetical protein PYH37_003816 [Sinorhizobium numidicum]WEX82275.1 hypothetical protein PYH38_004528 [Sinorhizobium numidicum]
MTEAHSTATIAQRAKRELKEYALLSAYLYVCFGALVLYKMAILGSQGVHFSAFGVPVIKALILGKFILLGHAVKLGERYGRLRLVSVIAYKAVLYLLLLIVLSIIEEAIIGLSNGRTIAVTLAEIGGGKLPEMLATSVIMLLILIPYLASREFAVALGEGRLWDLLFEYRDGLHHDGSANIAKE